MMMSLCILGQHGVLIFTVLAHWNIQSAGRHVVPFDYTLSWFWTNQYLPLLFNAACLAEKLPIPILLSFVWHDRNSNTRSTALGVNDRLTIDKLYWVQDYNFFFFIFACFGFYVNLWSQVGILNMWGWSVYFFLKEIQLTNQKRLTLVEERDRSIENKYFQHFQPYFIQS